MSHSTPRQQSGHVLVIDDDVELFELIGMRLRAHGLDVSIAPSGREGLARLQTGDVDAVVLDLRLGDVDGLDVLAQIRSEMPDMPVVMLTAHGTIETAVEAMRRGAYGFLTKPFQDHELLQKLVHAVERRALQREVERLREQLAGQPRERLLGVSPAIS
ncbi:MAG: sigma-54-dependent transcriptional regulator, partial [Myxococcales bacterium]